MKSGESGIISTVRNTAIAHKSNSSLHSFMKGMTPYDRYKYCCDNGCSKGYWKYVLCDLNRGQEVAPEKPINRSPNLRKICSLPEVKEAEIELCSGGFVRVQPDPAYDRFMSSECTCVFCSIHRLRSLFCLFSSQLFPRPSDQSAAVTEDALTATGSHSSSAGREPKQSFHVINIRNEMIIRSDKSVVTWCMLSCSNCASRMRA
jgi:hypothetical protein